MAKQEHKSKKEQEKLLSRELEMSFPASDPPASTQPGSGITGAVPALKQPQAKRRDK
jgi:hypothetical protein